ncbi:unnamed protein product, partial [Mesorhabditis spiculigera]
MNFLELIPNSLQFWPITEFVTPVPPPSGAAPQVVTMTGPILRLAGVSGAAAVILGAYGSHSLSKSAVVDGSRLKAFDTASRYHLIHSVALLGAPYAKFPKLTSALIAGGILIFCGPCYHYSITGSEAIRRITPTGGILFILGWLSFML